jgi:hypothetical protein
MLKKLKLLKQNAKASPPISDSVSIVTLATHWVRLDDPVYVLGWVQSASDHQTNNLTWVSTMMVCRSKGLTDLTQPGAWDNLNILTDGVLFVKDHQVNKSLCHVSHMIIIFYQYLSHNDRPSCCYVLLFYKTRDMLEVHWW